MTYGEASKGTIMNPRNGDRIIYEHPRRCCATIGQKSSDLIGRPVWDGLGPGDVGNLSRLGNTNSSDLIGRPFSDGLGPGGVGNLSRLGNTKPVSYILPILFRHRN